jgi:hypothetical protein
MRVLPAVTDDAASPDHAIVGPVTSVRQHWTQGPCYRLRSRCQPPARTVRDMARHTARLSNHSGDERANSKGKTMVANIPTAHTPRQYDYSKPIEQRPRSRTRHYDSFVVRLWQDEGSEDMLRVELQHVQAGLSMEAVQVPLDWVLSKIMGCLNAGKDEQSGASVDRDDAQ